MSKIEEVDIIIGFEQGKYNRELYRHYAVLNESLTDFEKKASRRTFIKLFEPYEEGDRLWNHFVIDCDHKVQKFLTYLTQEQKNELYVNAHENKAFLYS